MTITEDTQSSNVTKCEGCGCPLAAGHRFCSDTCRTTIEQGAAIVLDAPEAARLFANVALFTTKRGDARPTLEFCRVTTSGTTATWAATDSYALIHQTTSCERGIGTPDVVFFVQHDTLTAAAKSAKSQKRGPVVVTFREGVVTVAGEGWSLTSERYEYEYPRCDALWSSDRHDAARVGFSAPQLARLAKVQPDGSDIVRMEFNTEAKPCIVTIGNDVVVLQMPARF